jgi:hypothetical protein
LIGIRKTAKKVVYPSSPLAINSISFAKSPLESLTMLFRLPISSTISFPILSPPKQSEMYSKTTIITLLSIKYALYLVLLL